MTNTEEMNKAVGTEQDFDDTVRELQKNLVLKEADQFKHKGVVYQTVARLKQKKTQKSIPISIAVDHTPGSKYTGEKLRELRKVHGHSKKKQVAE